MGRSSLEWDTLEYELQPWVRSAIETLGFDKMTPVQASTIPLFAGNKDVVVDAETGSGKTVAFVVPILEKIVQEQAFRLKRGHFHSLILTPTRELAKQIETVVQSFLVHYTEGTQQPIGCQLLVGTNEHSIRDDVNALCENRPQLLIGTPGRVLDLLQSPKVKTQSCSLVVLDEADRLLDASFVGDIEKILKVLPKQRRTGLFSATISAAGDTIFKTGLRNPVKIKVNGRAISAAPESLSINYCTVKPQLKLQLLISLINRFKFKKCIVYFPTCISVTFFYSFMNHLLSRGDITQDVKLFSLHGKLQTSSRIKTLDAFASHLGSAVLLTTDVAARGIDIPDVELVVQLDPPTDTDLFLHRCGRTGRANRIGKAVTFLNEGREEDFVGFMAVKNVVIEEDVSLQDPEIEGQAQQFYNTFLQWILEDRDRFDYAVKSYVAFIRYYSKHAAHSIFRLQNFDFVGLAKMYGLFRLPRMPEITKNLANKEEVTFGDGWLMDPPPVDMDTFAYRDAKLEQKRLEELKNLAKINDKKKLKFELKKKNVAWSNKTDTKETKQERREKMSRKRKAIEEELARQGSTSDKDDDDEIDKDWKETILKRKKGDQGKSNVQGSFDDL
ncbi:ATP-dependent RNA helicase SPB4 KNAG_0L00410 [Huiozyma naganishii CBS 8797]|uniref:ATP-dependent RNA helicase n=1 Tax=Huiozyma naganishii (strain ATCC MYA-139 / BCRC 22969 / CBS 8797 / KCTC 17520 / NBRC 10181 / NCYC 3082 / Yp74L-3) TaxID=1071383 RepID=J7SAD6_HUIN7|nr:hypothetical protein KNAG_0L00410 [Kazachstania naganishii CBS 8797]CCK72664.1 hypothetical protein KNAG_0L00410 [Kazachstania naganishii CBS 8797]